MKYEVKNIPLSSVVFSVYPLLLLLMGIIGSVIAELAMRTSSGGAFNVLWRIGVYSFTYLISMLAISVILVVAYNFFCSVIGMRGVSVRFDAIPENDVEQATIDSI